MSESAASCLEELNAIREYLGAVQASLKTGDMPDIAGLEKRVEALCLKVQKADEAVQKQCLPELSALLQDLDECERDLKEWQAAAMKTGSDP
jgi:hypothetical protein